MATVVLTPELTPESPPATAPVSARPRLPSPWVLMLPVGLALALLPPLFSASAIVAAAGVAVVLARPRWALYALALSVPYQSLADFKLYNVSISVTEGLVLLLLLAWITQIAAGRAPRPRGSPLVATVGGLVVTLALSTVVATDLNLSAKELLKWIELAAVCLAGASLLQTPGQRRALLYWLLAAALSEAVVGLVQSVLRYGPPHFMIGGLVMRAYGTFEQPNPYGGYLGLTLPVAVALYLFALPPGRTRRMVGISAGLIGAALAITLSRGAWAGQVVALLLVIMVGSRTARHAVIVFGSLMLLAAAGLWPLLPAGLSGRLASVVTSVTDLATLRDVTVTPDNWALVERFSQWYAGWRMFADNPVLGIGIGNYNSAYDRYRLDQWPVALGHAHNHYLTIAAEAGLLGLFAYVAFLVVAFRTGIAAYRSAHDRTGRAVAIGILGSLAAFAAHNLFDVLFVHGMGVTVGLLLALLQCIPRGLEGPQ